MGIELKGGRARNELTKFRYDVVMRVGGERPERPDVRWVDWRGDGLTLDALRRRLAEEAPAALGVASVPNGRLQSEARALRWLAEASDGATVGDLRLVRVPFGVGPEDVWALAAELPYRVDVCWSGSGVDARMDLLFRRLEGAVPPVPGLPRQAERPQGWSHYANNPLQGLFAERMAPRLRAWLAERLPEYMVPAVFVPLDALPLSANGKLDRKALPPPESERPELAASFVAPRSAVEETLARIWFEILRLDHVGVSDNFFELGGDSILSMQIVARANQKGLRLTARQMFQHQTISELAAVAAIPDGAETPLAEQGAVTGPVPLTPIQRWFFARELPNPDHYNLAVFLAVAGPLDPARLDRAVERLTFHHDALRLRFTRSVEGWSQRIAEPGGPVPSMRIDLSALPERLQRPAVESAAGDAQTSLDLARGPLLRAVSFDLGPDRPGRLLLAVHHLAVDGVSWRILLEDLETAYDQPGRLPAKTASFRSWARRLGAETPALPVRVESGLPLDLPGDGPGLQASARTLSSSLGEEETRGLLHDVPGVYGTRINDALLAALAAAFTRWTGRPSLRLDLESHGRDGEVDLSRTVGWFTALVPVELDLAGARGPGEALVAVKEQLRKVSVADAFTRSSDGVLFNYLGQLGDDRDGVSLFAPAPESAGATIDPRSARSHLLQIDCSVADGRLRAEWTYSAGRHRQDTIEGLAKAFFDELAAIVEHCRTPGAGAYTPSDFPEAELDEDDFATLMARLSR